ncbi:phospholipase, partial [Rhyzopertha dominica]
RDLISNNPSSSPWKPIRKDDVGETTYANDVTTKNNLSDNGLETSSEGPRPKRGVIHLYNMLSCATGCNPLIYKGYGCYCGFLGSGRPVDGIDSCCKRHDWCYNNSNCPFFLEYFVPYHWKCHSGRPLCGNNRFWYDGMKIYSYCLQEYNVDIQKPRIRVLL